MDVIINLLIWIHILAFIAGGSNSVVGPIVGGRLATAGPELRPAYFSLMDRLSTVGKVSMVLLLITGPLIVWLRYGGIGGASPWFWVKMALVVVMLVSIIFAGIQFKKYEAGDEAAGHLAEQVHKITLLAGLGVVLSAVFAFN